MRHSVCTSIILVSVLEHVVSVEANGCILVASRSKPSDLECQSSEGTKRVKDWAVFTGVMGGLGNLSKSAVDNDKNFQTDGSIHGPTMHKLPVYGCHDGSMLLTWYLTWVHI